MSAATLQTTSSTIGSVADRDKTTFSQTADGSIAGKTDNTTDTGVTYQYDVRGNVAVRTEHGHNTVNTYYPDGSLWKIVTDIPTQTYAMNTGYEVGQCIVPTVANGHKYRVTVRGTTALTTQPTWPLGTGQTVASATVTFQESTCKDTVTDKYDRNGQMKSSTTTVGEGSSLTYTARDRTGMETDVTGFDGDRVRTTYDLDGNVLSQIQHGVETTNTYGTTGNSTGLLASSTISLPGIAGASATASYAYNDNGNLLTVTRGVSGTVRNFV
jgi:hypothetical protein